MNDHEAAKHAEAEYAKIESYLIGVAGHITAEHVEVMAKLRHEIGLKVAGLDAEPWESLSEGERSYERVNTVYTIYALYQLGFTVEREPSFHGMPEEGNGDGIAEVTP